MSIRVASVAASNASATARAASTACSPIPEDLCSRKSAKRISIASHAAIAASSASNDSAATTATGMSTASSSASNSETVCRMRSSAFWATAAAPAAVYRAPFTRLTRTPISSSLWSWSGWSLTLVVAFHVLLDAGGEPQLLFARRGKTIIRVIGREREGSHGSGPSPQVSGECLPVGPVGGFCPVASRLETLTLDAHRHGTLS